MVRKLLTLLTLSLLTVTSPGAIISGYSGHTLTVANPVYTFELYPGARYKLSLGPPRIESDFEHPVLNKIVAYNGNVASLQPGQTIPIRGTAWPYTATFSGQWSPNDVRGYVGLITDPYNDDREDHTYYGWLEVSLNSNNTMTLHSWAYENVPGKRLAIPKSIPEPSIAALLFIGVTVLLLTRRKHP